MTGAQPLRAVISEMAGVLTDSDGSAFSDAAAGLGRWHRGELLIAIVSASSRGRDILEAAGLLHFADVVVDGRIAGELALAGKRGLLEEAARRLQVPAQETVVLEGAAAGVRAAREAGFGLVLGVSRNGNADELRRAGAHDVVPGLHLAAFPRRIPALLDHLDDLPAWRDDRPPALFIDYDGTLSPIVEDPAAALLPDATRTELAALAALCPVAVISGRDREDVAARVGLGDLLYAGNHGFDVAGRGQRKLLPEAEASRDEVARATADLRLRLAGADGVIIEPKRFSVAIHYRRVRDRSVRDRVQREVAAVRRRTGLRQRSGKEVLELEPDVAWHKGHALRWLMEVMDVRPETHFVLYIGDDVTDEDAFAALAGDGVGVLVGGAVSASLADYRVDSPEAVRVLLGWIRRRLQRSPHPRP